MPLRLGFCLDADPSLTCIAGHEFCAELRKTVPEAVVPVIMVSAKNDEANIVEGLTHGCNDFVRYCPMNCRALEAICACGCGCVCGSIQGCVKGGFGGGGLGCACMRVCVCTRLGKTQKPSAPSSALSAYMRPCVPVQQASEDVGPGGGGRGGAPLPPPHPMRPPE